MENKDKKTQINIMLDGKSRAQLAELQRILANRTGMKISQGQAVACALNFILDSFANNKSQGRLI